MVSRSRTWMGAKDQVYGCVRTNGTLKPAGEALKQAAEDRILGIRISAAAQGSEERHRLEMEALDVRYEREIAAAKKRGEDVTAIELAWILERNAKEIEYLEEHAARAGPRR